MDTQEKTTQVLERQITEVQERIIQCKVNVADLFIKVSKIDIKDVRCPKDLIPLVEDMDMMPKYISNIKENETILEVLTKTRDEIETTNSN